MAKELSDLLTDLSGQARKVEATFAAIAEETDAAATVAVYKLDQSVTAAGNMVASD